MHLHYVCYHSCEKVVCSHLRYVAMPLACMALYVCHWLNVEMGRFNGIPRSKRLCSCCDRSEVEDEMHLLICPMYDHIRNNLDVSFKQLLCLQPHGRELDMLMYSYMNFGPLHDETLSAYSFWHKLASYLTQSKYCRNDVLS